MGLITIPATASVDVTQMTQVGGGYDSSQPNGVVATLTLPTSASASTTSGTAGITSTENTGIIYRVATATTTKPSGTQIKAGQDNTGASVPKANDTSPIVGINTQVVSGLTEGNTYYFHTVQETVGGFSTVETSPSFVPVTSSDILMRSLNFDSGVNGALPNGSDAFNEPFFWSEYDNTRAVSGNQSCKFVCFIGAEGFGRWGAVENLTGSVTTTNYQVNNAAGYSIGATVIAIDSGVGAIDTSTWVSFSSSPDVYNVSIAIVDGATSITLASGLTTAISDNDVMTITNSYMKYGETLITEYSVFMPNGFNISTAPGFIKTLRYTVIGSINGNVEYAENPAGGFNIFSEVGGEPSVNSAAGVRTNGVFQKMRFEAYFHNTQGTMRLYADDVLIAESTGINTMNATGDLVRQILWGTNWNDGAPLTLINLAGGVPAKDDIISSNNAVGTAGQNFASIYTDNNPMWNLHKSQEILTLTHDGAGTATGTTSQPIDIGSGESGEVLGADQAEYNENNRVTITVINSTTFTYPIAGTPVSPATGTYMSLNNRQSADLGLRAGDQVTNGTWTADVAKSSEDYWIDDITFKRRVGV